MLAAIKGCRTVVFNLIMLLLGMIALLAPETANDLPDATAVHALLDNAEALILALTTIGNLALRAFTDTKIFKKE